MFITPLVLSSSSESTLQWHTDAPFARGLILSFSGWAGQQALGQFFVRQCLLRELLGWKQMAVVLHSKAT